MGEVSQPGLILYDKKERRTDWEYGGESGEGGCAVRWECMGEISESVDPSGFDSSSCKRWNNEMLKGIASSF